MPPPLPRAVAGRQDAARCRLARIAAARSGDKGASANVGVWVRTDEQLALAGAYNLDRRASCKQLYCPGDRRACRSPATCCPTCAR